MSKNANLKVAEPLEKATEKKEPRPTHKWVRFPTPISSAQTRSTKDFLKLQPVPCNREVEERAKKLVKHLFSKNKVWKQNEVDIVKYTGPTINSMTHGTWIKDEEYVLNGNTRGYIWRTYANGQTLSKIDFLELPDQVVVNVYESSDIFEIINAYDTIDSPESVETSSATLSGVLRAQDMHKLNSIKLKTGKFVMALDISAPIKPKFGYKAISGDVYNQVTEMKELIKQFDILRVSGRGALSTQVSMGVAFMAGKYAGASDGRYMDGLIRLSKVNLKDDSLKKLVPKDGIDYIILGSVANPYGHDVNGIPNELPKALPFGTGLFNDRTGALNYISACWKSYLDGEEMTSPPSMDLVENAYVTWMPKIYKSGNSNDEE